MQSAAEILTGVKPATPDSGVTVREEFGGQEVTRLAETSVAAVAAQAQAAVQARYLMALQKPRKWANVRYLLLEECKRPSFAQTALYYLPFGEGIWGLNIRFAEAMLRCMGNIYVESPVLWEDDVKRIVRVSVTDLEANLTYFKDIVIDKTVERRDPGGKTVIRARQNSEGRMTYLVAATESEMLSKQAALVSKALRSEGLRLLPGDIREDCWNEILKVRKDADAKDPQAEGKKIFDSFAAMGISAIQICDEFLGHDIATLQPAELSELRGVYSSIKEGHSTWAQIMEARAESRESRGGKKPDSGAGLRDRVKGKDKGKSEPPAAKPAATAPKPAEGLPIASSDLIAGVAKKLAAAEPEPCDPPMDSDVLALLRKNMVLQTESDAEALKVFAKVWGEAMVAKREQRQKAEAPQKQPKGKDLFEK